MTTQRITELIGVAAIIMGGAIFIINLNAKVSELDTHKANNEEFVLMQSNFKTLKEEFDSITDKIDLKTQEAIDKIKSDENKLFPIGTLLVSPLDFNKFSEASNSNLKGYWDPQKSKWSPADGRSVKGSIYAKKYNEYTPDLRGQFVRGYNIFDSSGQPSKFSNGNDLGKRSIKSSYSYQDEDIKNPQGTNKLAISNLSVKDRFIYSIYGGNYKSQSHENNNNERVVPATSWSSYVETGEGGDGSNQYGVRAKGTITTNTYKAKIIGGGKEIRPKNIAMYYYIRIN